jgi:TrmH family RNA methyltransferase
VNIDITSVQNPRIKEIVKLRDDRRRREQTRHTLVEGADEIRLARSSGLEPLLVLVAPEIASRPLNGMPAEVLTVQRNVFRKISYRDNPDGYLAVFGIPERSLDGLRLGEPPLVLVADSLEKPGNLGAILRTADAARIDAVLSCGNPVDLWSPNVIRASRGAAFTVASLEVDDNQAMSWLRNNRIRVIAASPSANTRYTEADMSGPIAIAVGAEDAGLSAFWMEHSDIQVSIPMLGRVNSLNVSVSTAVLVYEAVRQRRHEKNVGTGTGR